MIVAVHQPNFIPYFGYFKKISKSDLFVFLDHVQYAHRGFTNRNKIRTPRGWMWLTIPIQRNNRLDIAINDVLIDYRQTFKKEHIKALQRNYNRAEYFENHISILKTIYGSKWLKLSELNIQTIKEISEILGLKTEFVRSSQINYSGDKTDLLVSICKELDADRYLSGATGKKYLDIKKFEDFGIEVIYNEFTSPNYKQVHDGFIPNLSIIDFLFSAGKERVVEELNES